VLWLMALVHVGLVLVRQASRATSTRRHQGIGLSPRFPKTVLRASVAASAPDPLEGLDISAALYHFIRRDAVLKRMLPRARGGF